MGCSKDDVVVDDNLIKSYHTSYMLDYPPIMPFANPDDMLIRLEYSNNKISKRIGDAFDVDGGGYTFIMADFIYDKVSYNRNKIVIEKKSSDFNIDPYVRTIDLNNDGTMLKKTSYKPVAPGVITSIDTITTNYFYDSTKLLIKTYSTKKISYSQSDNNLRYYEDALYYYNDNRNLDSIITTRYGHNELQNIYEFKHKVVETFTDYDSATNPTKHLNIFDETFLRSLSNNNFRTYKKVMYTGIPLRFSSMEGKSWSYYYNEDGSVRFDK